MQRVTGQKCENPVDVAGFRIHGWTAGALACAQSILRGTGTLACAPCLLVASCQLLAAFSSYKQNTNILYTILSRFQYKSATLCRHRGCSCASDRAKSKKYTNGGPSQALGRPKKSAPGGRVAKLAHL